MAVDLRYLSSTFPAHFMIEMCYNRKSMGGLIYEQAVGQPYKNIILENYGVFNGCEELSFEIVNISMDKYRDGCTRFSFYPTDNILAHKISVQIVPGNSSGFISSSQIGSNGKYDPLKLRLAIGPLTRGKIMGSIMHELIHAYENLMKQNSNGRSLIDNAYKIGYDRFNIDAINNYEGERKWLAYLFYHFSDFERNAYIAQIYGNAKDCDEVFDSASDALEWIRGTVPYKNYMNIMNYANSLMKVKGEGQRKYLLKIANDLTNYNFSNYKEFQRWIRVKTTKYSKKFNKIVPKIAAQVLQIAECLSPPITSLIEGIEMVDA